MIHHLQTETLTVTDVHEIHGLDDEGPVALYVKGHVSTALVWAIAADYVHARGWDDKPGPAYQTWWRKIPNVHDGGSIIKRAVRGSRGSFPVTVCDLRPWTT